MAVAISVALVAKNNQASTDTYGIVCANIFHVRPASQGEITAFPTAVTAVVTKDISYNSAQKATYLTATATATVISAMNA